jgi:UPF0755 protein
VKKLFICVLILFLLTLSAIGYGVIHLFRYAESPSNPHDAEKTVMILPGQDLSTLTKKLTSEGIITHPVKFKLIARLKGYAKQLKAGEYALGGNMPPIDILQTIVNGKVRLHRLTVPEGYNLKQISKVVAETGLISPQAFLKACADSELIKKEGISGKTFEGYLFPDTYFFPKGVGADKIISTMVKRFWSVYTPEWQQRTEELGYTIHEIITLASIIEKETGEASERPVISSVFHNRIKKGMRLESDPTVIYGIDSFDGNITRKHLSTPTPYNTYTQKGLPPGPIANPGKASIQAALYPADTPYIYFVAKGDGTHQFSTNIKEHTRAVRHYQLKR